MEYIDINLISSLENNPRTITKEQFAKLVTSIKENPKYFEARPLILSDRSGKLVVIAGNQRYHAALKLKLKKVPCYIMEGLTEEKEKEILIRDNVQNGKWDWDVLANYDYDINKLKDWGVETYDYDNTFDPNLNPTIAYNEVTQAQILKEAERLAGEMVRKHKKIDCVCPECGEEFQIDG